MGEFTKVANLSDLGEGRAVTIDLGGTPVALYNVGGTIYATANTCPHRGGPLGEGALDDRIVTCPWHGFRYDVTSGACATNPALRVACYPVRVEGEDILVRA